MRRLPQSFFFVVLLGIACSGCCADRENGRSRDLSRQDPAIAQANPAAVQKSSREEPSGKIDLARVPLDRIPVGTVIGKEAPQGWTNLVLFATPTLTAEDLRTAPQMATHYARLFKFTVLANVARKSQGGAAPFYLERVARGFATDIRGKEVVIDGQHTQGATLGLFGKTILEENENVLDKDVLRLVRTDTMLIFDAKTVMLRGTDHVNMITRHALVVDPRTGRLYTMVWLLTEGYEPAEDAIQLLPEGMQEKRVLSVRRDKFNALGVPSRDAFALRQIPQGTAIAYTPELRTAASVQTFQESQVPAIEQTLRAAAMKAAAQ